MSKIEINLSERDRRRLLKYCNQKLNSLGYDKILEEVDIECYKDNLKFYRKKSLKCLERNLAIIKNDIKMFEKLKKSLEVEE